MRALAHALDSGRLHHAFLFTGTRGVGKTTIARIFAKSLNCEKGPTSNPCGECGAVPRDRRGPLRRPARDRRREQHRHRQRSRADRQRAVRADARPLQGLSHRRSAHALEERVQRAPEDARGAAAARQVPARDDRSAEAAGHRALALHQVQPEAPHAGADRRPAAARSCAPKNIAFDDEASTCSRALPTDRCATDFRCSIRRSRTAAASSPRRTCTRCSAPSSARRCARCSISSPQAMALRCSKKSSASRASRRISRRCSMSSARLLHRIQLLQLVPGAAGEDDAALLGLAGRLKAEDVQLWYQMASPAGAIWRSHRRRASVSR